MLIRIRTAALISVVILTSGVATFASAQNAGNASAAGPANAPPELGGPSGASSSETGVSAPAGAPPELMNSLNAAAGAFSQPTFSIAPGEPAPAPDTATPAAAPDASAASSRYYYNTLRVITD